MMQWPLNSRRVALVLAAMVSALTFIPGTVSAAARDAATIHSTTVDDVITAVSCSSAKYCQAIGDRYNGGPGGGTPTALILERWNGSSWVSEASHNVAKGVNSVSCVSSSFCAAAGDGDVLAWNGTNWIKETMPTTSYADFLSVSCVSSKFCVAVGDALSGALSARWNGTDWSLTSNSDDGGRFQSVSCVTSSYCVAVGSSETGLPYSEWWNGVAWTPFPTYSAPKYAYFTAVSCVAANECTAVGGSDLPTGDQFSATLADSHWTRVEAPGSNGFTPWSISCHSTNQCQAVGLHSVNSPAGPYPKGEFAEGLAGSSWNVATKTTSGGLLLNVSCTSSSNCWAVGSTQHVGSSGLYVGSAILTHWNGTRWTNYMS